MGAESQMEEPKAQLPAAKRGMYVLPSLFTAGNIAIGYYIIMQAIRGSGLADPLNQPYFDRAALGIAFAIIFDGLDGRIARMTNTASEFGRELDSLADVITFGVAPSLLAYLWGVRQVQMGAYPHVQERLLHFGLVICFLFLICGACRLARFNISVNPKPKNPGRPGRKYFVGMPIPAGAGVIGAVIHFEGGSPVGSQWMSMLWLGLVLFTGFLMVSSWRFWSGKEIDMSARKPVRLLVLLALVIAVMFEWHRYALMVMALGYLMSGVLARLAYSWQRRYSRA
jgi:CDP-diacylglycerol--serine O-phosphatidyltransferase